VIEPSGSVRVTRRVMFAGDQPAFAITGVAIRVVGVGAEDAETAIVFEPARLVVRSETGRNHKGMLP
jgi:hypothetical protein